MTPAELKQARATLNLSQPKLAAALVCSVWAVRHWEQGRRKIPGTVEKLVKMLVEAKN